MISRLCKSVNLLLAHVQFTATINYFSLLQENDMAKISVQVHMHLQIVVCLDILSKDN